MSARSEKNEPKRYVLKLVVDSFDSPKTRVDEIVSTLEFSLRTTVALVVVGDDHPEGNYTRKENAMTVRFIPNDRGTPTGKLADAELHFSDGPLDGLKLIGFMVWERRNGGRNVTFPARQYSVNGERRSFALLRSVADTAAQDRLRDLIIEAYAEHEAGLADAV